MNYAEAVDYLFSRLPMYQRDGKSAYKKDLTNTIALLEHLGNPHRKIKSIHIAGTNGKGTSAHGIAAILQISGYKTGLYTSPHLKNFTERIRINGQEVHESFVVEFVFGIQQAINEIGPSFFEITVAMAFEYFARQEVDVAVIETGLGGRLDSTNVITPEVCLITNVGYDHMDVLGDTLKKVASEKAGIIKKGVPVVVGDYHEDTYPVFAEKAKEMKAELILAQSQEEKLLAASLPYHKMKNASAILTLTSELRNLGWKIEDDNAMKGLYQMETLTGLKGRHQILSSNPLIIADVAHNVEGLTALFGSLKTNKGKLHLVFGTVKDKDLTPIFGTFPEDIAIYWTQSHVPRSLGVMELCELGRQNELEGKSYENANAALSHAKNNATPEDVILVTGSTFVVAELDEL